MSQLGKLTFLNVFYVSLDCMCRLFPVFCEQQRLLLTIPCISKSSSRLKLLEISMTKYRGKIMVLYLELTSDQDKRNTHSCKSRRWWHTHVLWHQDRLSHAEDPTGSTFHRGAADTIKGHMNNAWQTSPLYSRPVASAPHRNNIRCYRQLIFSQGFPLLWALVCRFSSDYGVFTHPSPIVR